MTTLRIIQILESKGYKKINSQIISGLFYTYTNGKFIVKVYPFYGVNSEKVGK
jgi:hypothetical protein